MPIATVNQTGECWKNLEFISEVVDTSAGYVGQLRSALNEKRLFLQRKKRDRKDKREKRVVPLLVGAATLGIFAGLSYSLFDNLIPDQQLRTFAQQTERYLDVLEKRTNILDINTKRMATLVERIQQDLEERSRITSHQLETSAIQIDINTLLIHINDHISYLYHLLETTEGMLLINWPYRIWKEKLC